MISKKLFFSILFCSTIVFAQSSIGMDLSFDHQAYPVKNLEKMGDFYRDIFGFQEIPAGAGMNPPKRWVKNEEGAEMHLILNKSQAKASPKVYHIAFTVKDMDAFMRHLQKMKVPFGDWSGKNEKYQIRADGGAKQIYLQDPEGNWIEINQKID